MGAEAVSEPTALIPAIETSTGLAVTGVVPEDAMVPCAAVPLACAFLSKTPVVAMPLHSERESTQLAFIDRENAREPVVAGASAR